MPYDDDSSMWWVVSSICVHWVILIEAILCHILLEPMPIGYFLSLVKLVTVPKWVCLVHNYSHVNGESSYLVCVINCTHMSFGQLTNLPPGDQLLRVPCDLLKHVLFGILLLLTYHSRKRSSQSPKLLCNALLYRLGVQFGVLHSVQLCNAFSGVEYNYLEQVTGGDQCCIAHFESVFKSLLETDWIFHKVIIFAYL